MLKVRVIPSILFKEAGTVKGRQFASDRITGSILTSVKVFNNRDVDEIILLDVEATKRNIPPNYDILNEICEDCFVPLSFGGGINNIEQVRKLILNGVDKVVINSYAYKQPEFISEIAELFGKQCIVASVDVIRDKNDWLCYSESGTKNTFYRVQEWVSKLEKLGAGEIIITSIDKDGTMEGYDLELIKSVSQSCNLPIIASGGARDYQDFVDALLLSGASAVSASSIFQFTESTPIEAKNFMKKNQINIRY